MTAVDEIVAERRRLIEEEGWTPEHDDRHADGALARAAAAYAIQSADYPIIKGAKSRALTWWQWDLRLWKPKDRRRDLIKAGALIVAEIERLDRANGKNNSGPTKPVRTRQPVRSTVPQGVRAIKERTT